MLCGIDEAGRGCLAGPLVVAGVVLREPIEGLQDSKILSEKKREALYEIITRRALFHVVFCDNVMVDTQGLSACLKHSILSIQSHFSTCDILMDGNCTFGVKGIRTLVKADATVPEVSAASIIAKVSRDRYMNEMAQTFFQYGFEKHKGYGSALHVKMIQEHGYSSLHRKSFKIKSLSQGTLF